MEITTLKVDDAQRRYEETVWQIKSEGLGDGEKLLTKRHHIRIENIKHKVRLRLVSTYTCRLVFGQGLAYSQSGDLVKMRSMVIKMPKKMEVSGM